MNEDQERAEEVKLLAAMKVQAIRLYLAEHPDASPTYWANAENGDQPCSIGMTS